MKPSAGFTSCTLALISAVNCGFISLNDTVSLDLFLNQHQLESSALESPNTLATGPVEFKDCKGFDGEHAGFLVQEIALSPNPPVRGQDVNIRIEGDLREQMDQGARVVVKVWKWGHAFVTLTFDWCENIQELSCPVQPGAITFSKTQDIDRRIPTWKFSFSVETFNNAGDQIS